MHSALMSLLSAEIIRFQGNDYGRSLMMETENQIRIGTVEENTNETCVMTVLYWDHRSHVAVITL